ncbi:hypothetical protein GOP47_0000093 [Adiantum capillus-veneris]|uniref:Uncharacterized protein n=1 Tax=Adiantum capillus-veneris TaxID=13818 RepID=A0A9D4VCP0_ADICA|nr:hypothetical protein GOP47_0000093 [Adiantum capillus-veneris]
MGALVDGPGDISPPLIPPLIFGVEGLAVACSSFCWDECFPGPRGDRARWQLVIWWLRFGRRWSIGRWPSTGGSVRYNLGGLCALVSGVWLARNSQFDCGGSFPYG